MDLINPMINKPMSYQLRAVSYVRYALCAMLAPPALWNEFVVNIPSGWDPKAIPLGLSALCAVQSYFLSTINHPVSSDHYYNQSITKTLAQTPGPDLAWQDAVMQSEAFIISENSCIPTSRRALPPGHKPLRAGGRGVGSTLSPSCRLYEPEAGL